MKSLTSILSILSFIGVVALLGMHFSKNKKNSAASDTTVLSNIPVTGKIAYVDIDTLEANYEYLKAKKEDFKQRQTQMEGELESSYQKMQADAAELQKRAQAGNLSQAEGEAAQKRLGQMQESLQTRKDALTEQLVKEQEDFNKDLKTRLDNFLTDYNKDRHFDYILSYSASATGSILYANKGLNITNDVIKGLNELSKNTGEDKKKNK